MGAVSRGSAIGEQLETLCRLDLCAAGRSFRRACHPHAMGLVVPSRNLGRHCADHDDEDADALAGRLEGVVKVEAKEQQRDSVQELDATENKSTLIEREAISQGRTVALP